MKTPSIIIITLVASFFGASACSDCGQSAVGSKQGDALPLEAITLGADRTTFLAEAASLVGREAGQLDPAVACRDQFHLAVLDVDEREITERPAGKRDLTNCVVDAEAGAGSAKVIKVRGELLDGKLARLTYRFTASEGDRLKKELTARFGQGLETEFEDLDPLETGERRLKVWTFGEVVWSLEPGEAGTFLVTTQDLAASRVLPEPPRAAERGKPVSLEDIGLGKLDLKKPEPEIDLPDTGAAEDAGRDH